ncbi:MULTISPECIES: DUF2750 domain-containing protein [unclassified Devosia]|uniref:DUF2750 domain-containing protein n=1 Tax=unclassified Devosia TaxID=196773 RepID=UPI001AD06E42|nr:MULTISPECIES: DUF2750 domain-containing protein [unclassified Devosia]MBN9361249.1 DUF2750 domain-containing protein [Devosia sp.]
MSISAAHSAAFFSEVVASAAVWGIRDNGGFPVPVSADGARTMPFWSTRNRAEQVIQTVPAYAGFQPERVNLAAFVDRWLPGLERDGHLVGINWSGERATGYDMLPREVIERLKRAPRAIKPSFWRRNADPTP